MPSTIDPAILKIAKTANATDFDPDQAHVTLANGDVYQALDPDGNYSDRLTAIAVAAATIPPCATKAEALKVIQDRAVAESAASDQAIIEQFAAAAESAEEPAP